MFMKILVKISRVILCSLLVCSFTIVLCNAESTQTLYAYVMNEYNKEFVDNSANIALLDVLRKKYEVALQQNLQAESQESLVRLASSIQDDVNNSIDEKIAEVQLKEDNVVFSIEDGLTTLSVKELSKLNRSYYKYEQEIQEHLDNKTDILSIYENNKIDKVDTSELEEQISKQESIVGSLSPSGGSLGYLDEFKRPFDIPAVVTSRAGFRKDPFTGQTKYHNACDYAVPIGTPLRTVFNGTVVRSDNTGDGYGENIKIDCGNGFVLHYAHLSERYVNVGDKVEQNQIIGKSGNTGRSTGPHLHLSLFYNGEVLDIEELF